MRGSLIVIIIVIGLIVLLVKAGAQVFSFNPRRNYHHSEILKVLLNLNEDSFDQLLNLYRESFGPGAAAYARRTYQKWKAGEVRPNRQTFERFLIHLPKVMSYDLKCEVLRHLMEEYCSRKNYALTVYTDNWEQTLTPLVQEIIDQPYNAELPAEVSRQLHWLAEGEMVAAQELLRRSQVEEGKIAVSMLRREFESIENLLSEKHLKPKVTHQLKFPYGTITLNIKRRS